MKQRQVAIALAVAAGGGAVACKDPATTSEATRAAPSAQAPPAVPIGNASTPDTPAGRQFAAWATAFNAGDRGGLVAYHHHHFPYEVASADIAGIDRELELSQATGGFHLKKVESPKPTTIVVLLQERARHQQFARAEMEVDAGEPHRVVRFEIHALRSPDQFLDGGGARPPASPTVGVSTGDTPAGRQFAAWATAFNAGDRAGLVTYHQHHFPYEVASADVAGIDAELGLSQSTGGFDLKQLATPTPTSIVVTLEERHAHHFARAEMEVDAAEPHRVIRFEIHPIPAPEEFLSAEEREAQRVDGPRRRALIDGIARELQAHYVDPAKATQMIAALRAHLGHGEYDKLTRGEELAAAITRDLRDVSHDLHLGLRFGRGPDAVPPKPEEVRAMARGINYGFGPIERMAGNVAHVVIDRFPPITDDEARDAVGGLMSQVADADALLIDLRDNGGGSPDTVALIASYLFDPSPAVHLNDMYSRDTGAIQAYWTVRDLRGTRFGREKPVYVLTSKRTFSGGEGLAYQLQALHRATIVGETTGGGAHPVAPHPLDAGFTIMVPWGRPINPVTKTNWEGVGVVPDVAVTADAALAEAHRRAVADITATRQRPARP